MATSEAEIIGFLEGLGATPTLHRHPPLFTVEESQALRGEQPGAHVKNMFFKDKKGGLWLATCLEDRKIRIKDLEKALGAPRLSFGKPELLDEALGVKPGAVTPLAAYNDRDAKRVTVVLDSQMMTADVLNCHPLHNEATIAITAADLRAFFAATGHTPIELDFDALEAQAAAAEADAKD